jgi:hypothetical protein
MIANIMGLKNRQVFLLHPVFGEWCDKPVRIVSFVKTEILCCVFLDVSSIAHINLGTTVKPA